MRNDAPWSIGADSRTPLGGFSVVEGTLDLALLLLFPGGDLVELDETEEADAQTDRDLIPLDLGVAHGLAEALGESRSLARIGGEAAGGGGRGPW